MIKSLDFGFVVSFLHNLNTLLIEINSSWLIFKSIKDLEINTSILFNSDFVNNTILSCFFYFFLIYDLYFWILAVISQILNSIAELVIPIGIPTKEA